MSTKALRETLRKLDGPNHHDRDAQIARNGRWGTCGCCPQDEDGRKIPERCEYTSRSDHNIQRPNHDAWIELEAIEFFAHHIVDKRDRMFHEADYVAALDKWVDSEDFGLLESIARDAP